MSERSRRLEEAAGLSGTVGVDSVSPDFDVEKLAVLSNNKCRAFCDGNDRRFDTKQPNESGLGIRYEREGSTDGTSKLLLPRFAIGADRNDLRSAFTE